VTGVTQDREHVLVVEYDGDELHYDIEHPAECPVTHDTLGGIPLTDYNCLTGSFWREAGRDALSELPQEEGRYSVQAWYQGPGWAGSNPIDPEGWIDVGERK